jgi:hypothetical protein
VNRCESNIIPSLANINRPISVLGIGRSGTTLLCAALADSMGFQNCGETGDAVFTTALGFQWGLSDDNERSDQSRANLISQAVGGALCSALPSGKPGWVQKLAGLPKLTALGWGNVMTLADIDHGGAHQFPYEWYWSIANNCFPDSVNILCLRDPLEVISSRHSMMGWDYLDVWHDVCLSAKVNTHLEARIHSVFDLSLFQRNRSGAVGKLLEGLDGIEAIDFDVYAKNIFAPDPNFDYTSYNFRRDNLPSDILEVISSQRENVEVVRDYYARNGASLECFERALSRF